MTFVEPTLPQPLAAGGVATPLRHAAVTMAVPSWPTSGDTTHVLQSPQVPGSHVQVSPPTVQGTQQAQEQQATLEANLAQAAAQVSLQDTIAMLTTTIASLNERLKGLEDENKHLQLLIRENTKKPADTRAPFLPQQPSHVAPASSAYPRRSQFDDLADIDRKDVEKPPKYGGNLAQWRLWFTKFRGFLARRDARWGDLLDALKTDSKDPMTDKREVQLFSKIDVVSEELSAKFKGQLYEYLETFTEGMAHATVVTGGASSVLEVFRQLCDEGFSVRERHLRQEYRKVIHPKQASFDNLKKAMLTWETDLAQYQLAAGYDMKEKDKIMCLEDMCPDILQQHLDSKENLESYAEYKTAINDYLVNRHRWVGNGRGRLNWLGVQEFDSDCCSSGKPDSSRFSSNCRPDDTKNDHDHDYTADSVNECINSLSGEIMALVKGKLQKKGEGKGKTGKGAAAAPTSTSTPDVVMTDKTCYECEKPGHLARDCPQRQARIAAGGPARLPKGGKGKGKDSGKAGAGGKGWPTRQWWNNAYPGPSQQQWRSWYPQGQGNGRANLFQPPFQLSPIAPQGGPGEQPQESFFQNLFNPGGLFSLVEKGPKRTVTIDAPVTELRNGFIALATDDNDDHDHDHHAKANTSIKVKLADVIKPKSKNKLRKERRREKGRVQESLGIASEPSADHDEESGEHAASPLMRQARPKLPRESPLKECGSATRASSPPTPMPLVKESRESQESSTSTATTTPSASIDEDREWEAMKSASEEYRRFRDIEEKKKKLAIERLVPVLDPVLDHVGDFRIPHMFEYEDSQVEQRCHSCGWFGIPVARQKCPSCGTRNALSDSPPLEEEFKCLPCEGAYKFFDGRGDDYHAIQKFSDEVSCSDVNAVGSMEALDVTTRNDHGDGYDEIQKAKPRCIDDVEAGMGLPDDADIIAKLEEVQRVMQELMSKELGKFGKLKEVQKAMQEFMSEELERARPEGSTTASLSEEELPKSEATWEKVLVEERRRGDAVLQSQVENIMMFARKTAKNLEEDVKDIKMLTQSARVFSECCRTGSLRPLQTGTMATMMGKFQVISAIMDSGATVPVMSPEAGKDYELMESPGSLAGQEYEIANGDTLKNLGQKLMAVMTAEGTLRGYKTQCADVSKPLQSVRALVTSGHAVCFGLGDGNDHLVINKLTGEINRLRDDGINYLQDMLIIPPDKVDAMAEQLQSMRESAENPWSAASDQSFRWQGR